MRGAHKVASLWAGFAPVPWSSSKHRSFSHTHSTSKICVSAETTRGATARAWGPDPRCTAVLVMWKPPAVRWVDITISPMVFASLLRPTGSTACSSSSSSSTCPVIGGVSSTNMCCPGRAGDSTMREPCRDPKKREKRQRTRQRTQRTTMGRRPTRKTKVMVGVPDVDQRTSTTLGPVDQAPSLGLYPPKREVPHLCSALQPPRQPGPLVCRCIAPMVMAPCGRVQVMDMGALLPTEGCSQALPAAAVAQGSAWHRDQEWVAWVEPLDAVQAVARSTSRLAPGVQRNGLPPKREMCARSEKATTRRRRPLKLCGPAQ
mmetsp:Transcript_15437/g.33960  ORF Transcript_15437/g.33960 Transcript_15437/m.33960 type:complete len:317 (+) Transcript_15437:1371-2321(+)